ncbi:ABC-type glycerol-3-phosphate transport system, substrate-binding protein [Lachnospiraceae bacterium G41]|nr:ABC-type glycerol-3-phosphate transport system, substrate-binding protein [Lachnospiraceae bacterium G41]
MRLKKLMSVSLCMTMVLSLAGCTFNPKDTISNILNGKGDSTSNANIVASADKVNKDAVFKEGKTIYFDGFDYIDGLKSANGKYYAARIKYGDYEGDYSDGPVLYDVEEIEEDIEEDIEEEIPLVVDEKEPVDVDSEDVDNVDFEYEDDYYDGEYYEGDSKMTFTLASFTNADDVEYRSFEIDGGEEYFSGGNWGIDKEEKLYAVVASYDPMTYDESYKIRKYSLDGTVLKEVNVDSNNEQSFYVRYFFVDSEGNAYFLSEQSVTVFDKELNKKYYYKTDIKEGYLSTAKLNDNGELIFSVVSWENDKYSSKTFKMDDKGNVAEDTSLNDIIAQKSLVEGNGYDFYYSTNTSIMGINVGDKAATEVVNFYDSDINPGDFYGTIYFASAEEFLMTVQDENGAGLTFYEKVPAEEVKDKEIITLGTVYGSYYISSQIINYNKNNDNYRIKLVDYSELNSADDWDAGRKRFYTDISGGNAPDIIVPEAYDVTNLIDKGVFTDLTPLMENSDGVKKEDLVYNARTIFAKDDKLYCVFPSFTVEAMQIKKEFYKEGMTLDDVIEWEKATGNKALSGQMERDGVMSMIMSMSMNEFLDPKTGKCSFDSPEFAKLLEYANTYPESLPDDYWENYDFEQYMYEFRKNTALLNFAYVDDFSSYNWNAKYRFGEIPELIGVPLSGNDTAVLNIDTVIGISNKSKHKEAAWDFIKTCFEHEYYEELGWGIPSVEKELDLMAEKATEPYYYFDENGEKVYEEQKYFLIDHEEVITPLTKEEAAKLKDFLVHVEGLYTWDEELNNIIDEETDGYFAGQKSADEVASIIQSRLKIYINEKR